jgi:Tol biopolymer transport system component
LPSSDYTALALTSPPPTLIPDQATQQAMEINFGDRCPYLSSQDLSPDGNWLFCETASQYSTVIKLIGSSGSEWSFSYYDVWGEEFWGVTNIAAWSQDSRYVYFAPMDLIDAIEPLPFDAIALLRMDLADGSLTTILPPSGPDYAHHYYALSISPTGRRLAYIQYVDFSAPVSVHLLDLRTGHVGKIDLASFYHNVGDFEWSEDGTQFSFSLHDSGTGNYYRLTYSVLTLELLRSQAYVPEWVEYLTAPTPTMEITSSP